ncbi:hypothetical protein GF319_06150 [Candidatus Bathyarchaeota archaeon]|nr:hypothetical protein [Candidatus Bathyarchaeota archaeon]
MIKIIDNEQIYREISKISNLLSGTDITKESISEETINEENQEVILETIKILKEKEKQLRTLRQKLESKYFYYINKNYLSAMMSETQKSS